MRFRGPAPAASIAVTRVPGQQSRTNPDAARPWRMRPNVAFGASNAPNVAFGALNAPNATLGRLVNPDAVTHWPRPAGRRPR